MYTKLLIPLDGSKTAEKVLPYARFLAESLNIPAELTTGFDIAEFAGQIAPEKLVILIVSYITALAGALSIYKPLPRPSPGIT